MKIVDRRFSEMGNLSDIQNYRAADFREIGNLSVV